MKRYTKQLKQLIAISYQPTAKMKLYEFNYTNGSYEINNNPGFNPLWIAAAIGILITVLTLIYN